MNKTNYEKELELKQQRLEVWEDNFLENNPNNYNSKVKHWDFD